MSGSGSPELGHDAQGMRVAIVAASWHEMVMNGLIAGAARACQDAGADASIIRVPGSFELPIIALECAIGGQFDAVVALGVIIRGGTPHFEYVSSGTTDGLMRVSLDTKVPVGFGLLTCDTEQQALDRAGLEGSTEDKGAEAVWAALTTAATLRALREG
jgi:6,7-dimethyl-8-ribityllumazine synthase